jgi:hypothetical protein
MVKGPLADRLNYAILDTIDSIERNFSRTGHQDSWPGWESSAKKRVPEFRYLELLSAFKRLRNAGIIRLSKPDNATKIFDAHEYSGNDADDDSFFFTGPFNAFITDEGRSYWDGLKDKKSGGPIGFTA